MKFIKFFMMFYFILSSTFLYSFDSSIKQDIKNQKEIPVPHSKIENTKFTTYRYNQTFPFKGEAEKKAGEFVNKFREYGIKTIGYNIVEEDNDYTFEVEYIPEIDVNSNIQSILIEKYVSPKTYWNQNLAQREFKNAADKFKTSGLKFIDSSILEYGSDYIFQILYAVRIKYYRPEKNCELKIEKMDYGNFTFESEAKRQIPYITQYLKENGIYAVNAYPEENGRNWKLTVEYFNKTCRAMEKAKEYEIKTYISPEVFPFESTATENGNTKINIFRKNNMTAFHIYSKEAGNDYTYAISYTVRNIFKNKRFINEYTVTRYTNPETFDFKSEAEKKMNEKINNFNQIGLSVISSKIIEVGNNYSFIIDYISKN